MEKSGGTQVVNICVIKMKSLDIFDNPVSYTHLNGLSDKQLQLIVDLIAELKKEQISSLPKKH